MAIVFEPLGLFPVPFDGPYTQWVELQDMYLPSLANTASRTAWGIQVKEKKARQNRLARELRKRFVIPELPCTVTLIRESPRMLDPKDNLPGALKYLRDTVARWAHGLDETIIARDKHGFPKFKRGKVQMTRPHAPDGPKDGIEWEYDQVKARRAKFHALHIIFSEVVPCC
jgi:hypothetical protein